MIFRRIADCSRSNNGALARHQPWHGAHRAHRSRIGERNSGAFKILDRELIASGARHDIVERFHIPREIQLSGCFNVRHLERTGTVFARHVHRDTDVDLVVRHPEPLAVDLRVGMIESWIALNGFDDGPADDVRV